MVSEMNFTHCLQCGKLFLSGDYLDVFCSTECGEDYDREREEREEEKGYCSSSFTSIGV